MVCVKFYRNNKVTYQVVSQSYTLFIRNGYHSRHLLKYFITSSRKRLGYVRTGFQVMYLINRTYVKKLLCCSVSFFCDTCCLISEIILEFEIVILTSRQPPQLPQYSFLSISVTWFRKCILLTSLFFLFFALRNIVNFKRVPGVH